MVKTPGAESLRTPSTLRRQQSSESPPHGSIVLALDGKTLRGTIPVGQNRGVHLLTAFLPEKIATCDGAPAVL
jgi:hypothetical protein